MAFVTEKEELKPGLIIFRRGDVEHRMWYCRMKMPKADPGTASARETPSSVLTSCKSRRMRKSGIS